MRSWKSWFRWSQLADDDSLTDAESVIFSYVAGHGGPHWDFPGSPSRCSKSMFGQKLTIPPPWMNLKGPALKNYYGPFGIIQGGGIVQGENLLATFQDSAKRPPSEMAVEAMPIAFQVCYFSTAVGSAGTTHILQRDVIYRWILLANVDHYDIENFWCSLVIL